VSSQYKITYTERCNDYPF